MMQVLLRTAFRVSQMRWGINTEIVLRHLAVQVDLSPNPRWTAGSYTTFE